jgi:DNA (cytosine-5)-methyltransferase 1
MRFGSLFSGIGGLDLGLERAGMECAWQVEIDEYCQRVLTKHWPNVPKFRDVRECGALPAVDIIAGGDPCQENSGARQSTGLTQSSLGNEFIRIVAKCRPRLVLRENPSSVRPDAPWPWWRFRQELERLGYAVLPFRLRACCVGADHRRERLFLLAELSDSMRQRLQGDVIGFLEGKRRSKGLEHTAKQNWRDAPPRICGRVDRVPNRIQRTKALGNAVVPQCAELIGRMIMNESKPIVATVLSR